MKKLFLVLFVAALGLAPVMADQSTYLKPGTLTAQAGLGLYWGYYGGGSVAGGFDLGLAQVPFSREFPVDFGIAGRVGFGFGLYEGLGASVLGTAHYSWKAIGTKFDWLNRWETYMSLGLQVLPGLAFDGYFGNSYHFDDKFAVFLESGWPTTVLGLSYRF